MRPIRATLAILGFLAFAPNAFADGVASLSWDACVGPTNKSVTPGSVVDLVASVLGQSQTANAYEFRITVQPIVRAVADAWRFDPEGCQGNSVLQILQDAPAAIAGACPSFDGNLHSVQVKDFSYDVTGGDAFITLAVAYPNPDNGLGNPAATNPTQRYFLGDVRFDMHYGVTGPTPNDGSTDCGGLETPTCFQLVQASWTDLNGGAHPWTIGASSVTANDPTNASRCPGLTPTAARPSTWGSIKSQYRD